MAWLAVIPDLLLDLVGLLLELVALALPAGDPPFADEFGSWATMLHGWVFAFDAVVPVAEQLQLLRWVAVVFLPGWFGYVVLQWVVRHIPFLGMGG